MLARSQGRNGSAPPDAADDARFEHAPQALHDFVGADAQLLGDGMIRAAHARQSRLSHQNKAAVHGIQHRGGLECGVGHDFSGVRVHTVNLKPT
jgi:hypothetical protein